MNCLEDDFSADIFLDDLSVYFYGKVWEECHDSAERVTIESSEWKSGAWLIKTDSYGSFSVTKINDEIIVTVIATGFENNNPELEQGGSVRREELRNNSKK